MDTFSVKAERASLYWNSPAASGGMQVTVCIKTKHLRAFIAVKGDFNLHIFLYFIETLDLLYDK